MAALSMMGCDDGSADAAAGSGGGATTEPPIAGLGPWACEAGELALEDGSCLPAGIAPEDCGSGFAPTADRACEPILPSEPCADGEMAVPGDARCRPVAPCPAGTWGTIPVETSTEFVDGAYPNGDSDGSATKPWTSVQTAIDNAEDGAIVAVAAGIYTQPLVIQGKRVRLWGRCPSLVRILTTGDVFGLRIEAGADGSEVRDLAFESADDVAVHVGGAIDVLLDRIWVENSALIGVDIEDGNPGATLARSLIEDQGSIAIFGYGAELVIEDTEIRGVTQSSSGTFGYGIRVYPDGVPTELSVRRTVVSGAYGAGIDINESNAVIEDIVVRDIQPKAAEPDDGFGIYARSDVEGFISSLDLSGSYIERVHSAAVLVRGTGNVRTTVMRDVTSPPDATSSYGILMGAPEGGMPTNIALRSSVIERTTVSGISVVGAIARVEATIVRDTEPHPRELVPGYPDVGGRGIEVAALPDYPTSSLAVAGCRVERTHESAVIVSGAELTLESTLVSDVATRETDGHMGQGIGVYYAPDVSLRATVDIRASLVERTHEHAIAILDSDATIESTWIRQTLPSGAFKTLAGVIHPGRGIAVQGYTLTGEPASLTLDRVLVEESEDAGVLAAGADVVVRRSIVRTTLGTTGGPFGDGVLAFAAPDDITDPLPRWSPASLEVIDCIVEDNLRAGISNFWSSVTVGGTWLSCNPIDLNGEQFDDNPYEFRDLGGNVCRCGEDLRSCKVTSSGLQAPVATEE